MNYDIAKRIRRLRLDAGLKQEELAEKLHVTRQAVSAWENGKTAVSLEYLMAHSELFGVSCDEIIYGKAPAEYECFQRRYVRCCIVCAAVLAVCFVLHFTVRPWLYEMRVNYFLIWPYSLYTFAANGAIGASMGLLLPSIMALKADIGLGVRGRHAAAIIAAALLLAYIWCVLSMHTGFGLVTPLYLRISTYLKWLTYLQPFAVALCGFLAVNK